MTFTQAKPCYP